MQLFASGILLVLLSVLLLPHTDAAIARGIFKDAAHPSKCVVNQTLILSPGEIAKHPDMKCARIICQDNSYGQIQTCGAVMAGSPNCVMRQTFPNADYPKCCEMNMLCKSHDVNIQNFK